MKIFFLSHPDCQRHQMGPNHPEQPARLQVIETALLRAGLKEQLSSIEVKPSNQTHLSRVHTDSYIKNLFDKSPSEGLVCLDPDTYMNPHTLRAALLAAGSVVQGVDLVMQRQADKVFCSVRPPGHHAERSQAMGFCFFNNVAVGVAHAIEQYQLKRVAIVDFDVHHGNGTEDIFGDHPQVLYCSSFQYPFYPQDSFSQTHVNCLKLPLPAGTTGQTYRIAFKTKLLMPLKAFKPQMIFISAGFDGHYKDPLANFKLTEQDYAWITQQINQVAQDYAQGRIVSVLEGGYALDALGPCVVAHIRALGSGP